jgi:Collagen triple helix repeat (20 copies)
MIVELTPLAIIDASPLFTTLEVLGPVGPKGAPGPQGLPGLTGSTGAQGSVGPAGATGPQGLPGLQGTAGAPGATGLTGATGPQGLPGLTGATGAAGAIGLSGPQGLPGTAGPAGAAGPVGPQGLTGTAGPAGAAGLTGAQGAVGAAGPAGPQGPQGAIGATGATGATGPIGIVGPVGAVSGEDARMATAIIGVTPVASGTVSNSGTGRYILSTPATISGVVERVDVAVAVTQTAEFSVCSVNGDGTLNVLSLVTLKLAAGVNSVPVDLPISAGNVIGIWCQVGIYYSAVAGAAPLWSTPGPVATNTTKSVAGGLRLEFGAKLSGEVLGGVHALRNRTTALETDFGQLDPIGVVPDIAATQVTAAGTTWMLPVPTARSGRIRKFQVASTIAQTAQVVVANLNTDGTMTLASATPVAVAAGLNTIAVDIPVSAGQYVGYYPPSGGLRYTLGTGLGAYYTGGLVGTNTPKSVAVGGSFSLQFGCIVGTGVNGDVNWLVTRALNPSSSDPAGLSLLAGTVPADATAAFAAARLAHPTPYVPQGVYNVTALPNAGTGFWGPGRVSVNGRRVFLPTQPQTTSLLLQLRASLLSEIGNGAPLVLIGDSISRGGGATAPDKHWLSLFTSFVNLFGSPRDEPVISQLIASTFPFFGITTAGTVTQGGNGPVGASMVLAAGAACSFTGAYESIDLFYTQDTGAGTLAFSFNGAAAYKTVACAGALEPDKTTWSAAAGASLTGQAASGTYTITATGGPVEITGLMRLGAKAAGTAPRLVTFRAARDSFLLSDFTTPRVASVIKQAAFANPTAAAKPFVLIALGTNDGLAVAPALVKSRALALVASLRAAGVSRMAAVLPTRPSTAWVYPAGSSYDAAIGALTEAYQGQGVPLIPANAVDWVAEGLTGDGIHPNDLGYERMAQIVVEALAG